MTSLGWTYLQAEVGLLVPSMGAVWVKTAGQPQVQPNEAATNEARLQQTQAYDLGTDEVALHESVARGMAPLTGANAAYMQDLAGWRQNAGGQFAPYNPQAFSGRSSLLQMAVPVLAEQLGPMAGMAASFAPMILQQMGLGEHAAMLTKPMRMAYGGGSGQQAQAFQAFNQEVAAANADTVGVATAAFFGKVFQKLPENIQESAISKLIEYAPSTVAALGMDPKLLAQNPQAAKQIALLLRSNPTMLDSVMKTEQGKGISKGLGQVMGMLYNSGGPEVQGLINTLMPEYVNNIQPIMDAALYASGGVPDVNKLREFYAEFEDNYKNQRMPTEDNEGSTIPKAALMEAYAFAKYNAKGASPEQVQQILNNVVQLGTHTGGMGVALRIAQQYGANRLATPEGGAQLIESIKQFKGETGNASPEQLLGAVALARQNKTDLLGVMSDAAGQSLAGQHAVGSGYGDAVASGAAEALQRGRQSGMARIVAALKMKNDPATLRALATGDSAGLERAVRARGGSVAALARTMDPSLIATALSGKDNSLIVKANAVKLMQRFHVTPKDQAILQQLAANPNNVKLVRQLSAGGQSYYARTGTRGLGEAAMRQEALAYRKRRAQGEAAAKVAPPAANPATPLPVAANATPAEAAPQAEAKPAQTVAAAAPAANRMGEFTPHTKSDVQLPPPPPRTDLGAQPSLGEMATAPKTPTPTLGQTWNESAA